MKFKYRILNIYRKKIIAEFENFESAKEKLRKLNAPKGKEVKYKHFILTRAEIYD